MAMGRPVKNRVLRGTLLGLGFFFAGVGIVGIWVPLLPTTGPILLAAFLFSRSSERFDHWILNHRVVGPLVRDWRAGAGFPMRAKATGALAVALSFALTSWLALENPWVRSGFILFGLGLITYILRLPTKASPVAASPAVD